MGIHHLRACLLLLCLALTAVVAAQPPLTVDQVRRLPEDEQQKPVNQAVAVKWVQDSVRSHLHSLDALSCRELFSLGHAAGFQHVLQQEYKAGSGQLTGIRVRFQSQGTPSTLPVADHLYLLSLSSVSPESERTLWHEAQHVYLWRTVPDIYAAKLGPQFWVSLKPNSNLNWWRRLNNPHRRDDDGHHVLIEGYCEPAYDAYESLLGFEKLLRQRAEEEEQKVLELGRRLTPEERDAFYAIARNNWETFLKYWGGVAPWEQTPATREILMKYTGATGIFFAAPGNVADFYIRGGCKLKVAGGEKPILVPESVFRAGGREELRLKNVRISSEVANGVLRVVEHLVPLPGTAEGRLKFKLLNPDNQYTEIQVVPQSGAAPVKNPDTVEIDLARQAKPVLTFLHKKLIKANPGPYSIQVDYTDTTTPKTFDDTSTLVLIELPDYQARVTVSGPPFVAPGKAATLKAIADFTMTNPPAVTFHWSDNTTGDDLGMGGQCVFSSNVAGPHELEVEALTAGGERLGKAAHTITVQDKQLSISGPVQAIKSEIIALKVQVPPDIASQNPEYFWRVGRDSQDPKDSFLVRQQGLVGVPELAVPSLSAYPGTRPGETLVTTPEIKIQNFDGYMMNGGDKSFVVEARAPGSGNLLAASKPHKVAMLPGYFTFKLPSGWSKQDTKTGATLERPGQEYNSYLSFKWTNEGGLNPTKDKGSSDGPDGFRLHANRYVKGFLGFEVDETLPDPPRDPAKNAAHEAYIRRVKQEIAAIVSSLRITGSPSGATALAPPPKTTTHQVTLKRIGDGPVTVGSAISLQATLTPSSATAVFRWEPYQEVEYLPSAESKSPTISAVPRKPGPLRLWVGVLDGSGQTTLAESQPLELIVESPALSLSLDSPEPMVGSDVKATLKLPASIKEPDVRWELPAAAALVKEAQDSLSVDFYCKKPEPVQIKAHVSVDGEDLGTAVATVRPRAYKVSAHQVTPQGTVEAGQPVTLYVKIEPDKKEKVQYRWRLDQESRFITPEFGTEVKVSRTEPGSMEVTVVATDARQVDLGEAVLTIPFAPPSYAQAAEQAVQQARSGDLEGAVAKAEEIADPVKAAEVKQAIARVASEQALSALKKGDYGKALGQLELASKLDPGNIELAANLTTARGFVARDAQIEQLAAEAEELLKAGRLPSAYQKLLAIDKLANESPSLPGGERPARKRANDAYNQNLKAYNAYLDENGQKRTGAFQAKNWDALIALCDEALARWEHSEATRRELESSRKMALEQKVEASDLKEKARLQVEKADRIMATTLNLGEAIGLYSGAISMDPTVSSYFRKRGDAYLRGHDGQQKALWDFNQTLTMNPDDADALSGRGLIKVRELDPGPALPDLQRALQLDPNNARAHYAMGLYYKRRNQQNLALSSFRRAVELDPSNSEYRKDLDEFAQAGAENKLKTLGEQALKLMEAGKWKEAIPLLDQMIAIDPDLAHGQLWYTRAAARAQVGLYKEAMADLDRFLQLKPGDPEGLFLRGACLAALNRFAEAAESYTKAGLGHTDPVQKSKCFNSAGTAFQAAGQKNNAEQSYRSALQYDPNNQEARKNLSQSTAAGLPASTSSSLQQPAPKGGQVAKPAAVNVQQARSNNFVGTFTLSDPTRSEQEYRGILELRSNGTGRCLEYLDGKPIKPKYANTADSQGYVPIYWSFQNGAFTLDWTLGGKLQLGKFQGRTEGNTNDFILQGRWSSQKAGTLRLRRR